jgi:dTDP-glucose 4,6-dehydratase
MPYLDLPQADLEHVVSSTSGWEALRGQRLLLTGGTGFIGKWMLGTFLYANRALGLNARVVVLSRNVASFLEQHPALAAMPEVEWLHDDVRNFQLNRSQHCAYVIHAATDVVAQHPPSDILDSCIRGTNQVLTQIQRSGGERMLLVSSGAVYGRASNALPRIPEDWMGAPDCLEPLSAYGEGKRTSELLCAIAASEHGLQIPVARCFAFVGPYLALDKHFAIGNFIDSAIRDEVVHVQGDGTPLRSYLYAADLAVWLWTLLFRGQSARAYNVGGVESLSIKQLAHRTVAALGSRSPVHVAQQPNPNTVPQHYLPDLQRAHDELGLRAHVSLDQAIQRTAAWVKERSQ